MTFWRKELAADSNDTWFVGIETMRIHVLAPPGVSVSTCLEEDFSDRGKPVGWRWAVWNREREEDWPLIDVEAPTALREVDTTAVLRLIEEDLHEWVWTCLWTQLQVARQIGRQRSDKVPSEDLARAGALATAWLTDELSSAFPDRAYLLEPDDGAAIEAAPESADPNELVQLLCDCSYHSGLSDHRDSLPNGVIRWLSSKIFTRETAYLIEQRTWHAGDELAGCPRHDRIPGDRSGYGWGNESTGGLEPATEELMLP